MEVIQFPPAKPKTGKAPAGMTPLALAIERHRAAQAAIDEADGPEGYPDCLNEAEFDAIDDLAEAPCASDAEFLEKLRYETRIFGPPPGQFRSVVLAVDCHFFPVNE
ncbi:MAG: hypothetical protein WCC90_05385 [Methylocella sp.]